ncbi:uncharacterized protein [Amphiura filiformis]|uniref:uncharacterized protein n=1 Tax=Amphiura filiformis TaxID=82378 RepID=UPI003B212FF1
MVKPTLKPEPEKEKKEVDLKDDKLKEWGVIPAVVSIEETEKEKDKKDAEAALSDYDNLETDVDEARPTIVKCCACFAVFTIIIIVTCTIGSFIYFHYGNSEHKWKGWCSVRYNEDDQSGEQGHHGHHHGDRSEEQGHNNGLNPRVTGPPGGRQCGMESEVDLDNQLERVERPEEEDCERITILHDYNVNISAYRLWKSEICYVTWIEDEVLMNPAEFWTNMQDPEFLNQFFNELSLTYRAVLPVIPTPLHEQENGKYGEYLDGPKDYLCQGAETYWIEKIPEEEIEEFMQLVDQIMAELMALAEQYNQQEPQTYPEYHYGMPFPVGGQGGEGREDQGYEDWPMDGWPMSDHDRHHGGHSGGHHGGRSGGHHGEPHGMRRRRGANKFFNKIKKHQKDAIEAKECMQTFYNKIKEVGRSSVLSSSVVPPCVMQKVNKKMEMKK